MMTENDFRKLALAIPNAVESEHVGHPDFRLGRKVFASLGAPDKRWGMVKLTPLQQRIFLRESPQTFRPCRGAWGRRGYTNVLLESAAVDIVCSALVLAKGNVARGAPKRRSG